MSLRVVGAGVGRTGTESLKLALEHLLGGRCYHMAEVFGRLEDIPVWRAAAEGRPPDWSAFLKEFTAAVDWPAAAFWRELTKANPEALVLLSVRDVDAWWDSARATIFDPALRADNGRSPFPAGWPHDVIGARFTPDLDDERATKAAFLRHNDEVRATVAPDRLLEWRPGDGWDPICRKLGLPVPETPFPHANSTAEFRTRLAARSGGRDCKTIGVTPIMETDTYD